MKMELYTFGIFLLLIGSTPSCGQEITVMTTVFVEQTKPDITTTFSNFETTQDEFTTSHNEVTTRFTTMEATTDMGSLCGDDAYSFDGKCYFVTAQSEDCDRIGGNLAQLDPISIYNGVIDILNQNGNPDFWIGLSNVNNPPLYQWTVDDSTLTNANWDVNEPSLPCAYVVGVSGKWKTNMCDSNYAALCQITDIEYTDARRSLSLQVNANSSNPDNERDDSDQPETNPCMDTYGCMGDNIYCDINDGCLCEDGFEYSNYKRLACIETLTCAGQDNFCEKNEKCVMDGGIPLCRCIEGYTLSLQDNICKAINFCEDGLHNCDHVPNTECSPTVGSFVCICIEGYEMDVNNEVCRIPDSCTLGEKTCREPEERCVSSDLTFICDCSPGYARNPNTEGCESINECESDFNPCQEIRNTQCVDLTPGLDSDAFYSCQCTDGYIPESVQGGHCQQLEDNPCAVFDCDNGGSCMATDNENRITATCSCVEGFEGNRCEITKPLKSDPQSSDQGFVMVGIITASMLFILLVAVSLCACFFYSRSMRKPSPSFYDYTKSLNPSVVRNKLNRDNVDWGKKLRYGEERKVQSDVDPETAADALDSMRMDHFHRIFRNNVMKNVSSNFGYDRTMDDDASTDFTFPYKADGSINA